MSDRTVRGRLAAISYDGAKAGCAQTNPLLAARCILAFEGVSDRFRVVSTSRSYALQKRMYTEGRAGRRKVPAVANPDRVRSDGTKGSRHMVQPGNLHLVRELATGERYQYGGFSHAIDVTLHGGARSSARWLDLERRAAAVGLMLTVGAYDHDENGMHTRRTKAYEPWHLAIRPQHDFGSPLLALAYLDILLTGLPIMDEGDDALTKVAKFNEAIGKKPGTKISSTTLAEVAAMSQFIAKAGA